MKRALVLAAIAALLLSAASAWAEEVIRYKPILITEDYDRVHPPKVLIVDTKDGHVWVWQEEIGESGAKTASPGSSISYQGRVKPAKLGEVVARTAPR
ncbi:MAG: hypothetical protein PHV85_07715 [Desulfovibrionaceae bacterium]|nr:hypothetical protein [Desulfovibrionaceae bacterium]